MASQIPSVGRIVHYHSYGSPGGEFKPEPRAAIITDVKLNGESALTVEGGYDVQVCVLNPTGIFFNKVPFSDQPKPGCWSWPPRV